LDIGLRFEIDVVIISEDGTTHMGHQCRKSAISLRRLAGAFVVALAMASPVHAADPDPDGFKAKIDAFLGKLGSTTNGVVRWAGSDAYEIRSDGDTLVAVITDGRLSFGGQQIGGLIFDRIEIRQLGQREDGELKLIELVLRLPKDMTLNEVDGSETKITLENATARVLMEAQSGRGRESSIAITSTRLEQPTSGASLSIGPLLMVSKLIAEPNGGWSAPVDLTGQDIECLLPRASVKGTVNRIAFSGSYAGASLDRLNELRDAMDRLQGDNGRSSEARGSAFLAMLPGLAVPFASLGGEFAIDGVAIRNLTGEPLVTLAKAGIAIGATGLDGDMAALRLSAHHEGLGFAPSILDPAKVPHRVVVDLKIGDISTQALGKLLQAASAMSEATGESEDERQKGQRAIELLLGAATMFDPTFQINDLTIATDTVGVNVLGEARGSPFMAKGYRAAADVFVRGFDTIPRLGIHLPFGDYLPILREIGNEQVAVLGGGPGLAFRLVSAPAKWLTINGNDVGAWFDDAEPKQSGARLLELADPRMQGEDVKGVQRALAAAGIVVSQDGTYSSATAGAVARFQKQKGINVSGVVDAATRRSLGISTDVPR
jgi:hypothetical protein